MGLCLKQTLPSIEVYICGGNSTPTRRDSGGIQELFRIPWLARFANFRSGPGGNRPLYNVSTAGELVRFAFRPGIPRIQMRWCER